MRIPEKETLSTRVLLEKRIDGLILSTAFRDGDHPLLTLLKGVPLVTIVRKIKRLNADAVLETTRRRFQGDRASHSVGSPEDRIDFRSDRLEFRGREARGVSKGDGSAPDSCA